MGITVRRNFRFGDMATGFSSVSTMREIGNTLAVRMVNRTLAGFDRFGRRFAPYSPNYRKAQFGKGWGTTRAGKSRTKGKQVSAGSSRVDLFRTGKMLGDVGVTEATAKRCEIGFSQPAMATRAAYHDGPRFTSPVPRRQFFGITDSWLTETVATIRARMRLSRNL